MKNRRRQTRKLFDLFTKVFMLFAFIVLILTFVDIVFDIGWNSSQKELEATGGLAAFAVFLNLVGNWVYKLMDRYGPQQHGEDD